MIAEAIQHVQREAAEARKAGLRVFLTPSMVPGKFIVARMDDKGLYQLETQDYALKPITYEQPTVAALAAVMAASAEDGPGFRAFVGKHKIEAFALRDGGGNDLRQLERYTVPLTRTVTWEFCAAQQHDSPKAILKRLRATFTGMPLQKAEGAASYPDLLAALEEFAVKIEKSATQVNRHDNVSLGIDVQQQLTGTKKLPEIVCLPVQVYQQHKVYAPVQMLCAYDFDDEEVVLTPMQQSLAEAEDQAMGSILRDLVSIEGSNVVIGSPDLGSVGVVSL